MILATIAAVLASVSLSLKSADDYKFITPLCTNLITGTGLVGNNLRYDDPMFLREAYAELRYIYDFSAGSGSHSNNISQMSGLYGSLKNAYMDTGEYVALTGGVDTAAGDVITIGGEEVQMYSTNRLYYIFGGRVPYSGPLTYATNITSVLGRGCPLSKSVLEHLYADLKSFGARAYVGSTLNLKSPGYSWTTSMSIERDSDASPRGIDRYDGTVTYWDSEHVYNPGSSSNLEDAPLYVDYYKNADAWKTTYAKYRVTYPSGSSGVSISFEKDLGTFNSTKTEEFKGRRSSCTVTSDLSGLANMGLWHMDTAYSIKSATMFIEFRISASSSGHGTENRYFFCAFPMSVSGTGTNIVATCDIASDEAIFNSAVTHFGLSNPSASDLLNEIPDPPRPQFNPSSQYPSAGYYMVSEYDSKSSSMSLHWGGVASNAGLMIVIVEFEPNARVAGRMTKEGDK
jgi:hypothetical protein